VLWPVLLAEIALVELHGPSGQAVWINPHEVTSVRTPLRANDRYIPGGTRCMVTMANGNLIAVRDSCDAVRQLLSR